MNKAYIVSTGEYSSWKVAGVFDNLPDAQRAIRDDPNLNDQVDTYEVNKYSRQGKYLRSFIGVMDKDGNSYDINEEDINEESFIISGNVIHFKCFAKDKELAVKIVNEKRIRRLASFFTWKDGNLSYYPEVDEND